MQCPTPLAIHDMLVPCNRCEVCRQNRLSDWVVRLTAEYRSCVFSYFITLTYNDANLPINDNGDSCLVKRDVQLFMKRLRKRLFNHSIRYFTVGEYGTRFGRAHYHSIIFSDKPITYDDFNTSWDLGFIHIGQVTAKSISYVAKYVFSEKGKYGDRPP